MFPLGLSGNVFDSISTLKIDFLIWHNCAKNVAYAITNLKHKWLY